MDLDKFLDIYFAEAQENIDAFEEGVLLLEEAIRTGSSPPSEVVDRLFRAAHTLKGNSATFGFTGIVALTHTAESILDQVRSGERRLSSQEIDLLLRTSDVLRRELSARREQAPEVEELPEVHRLLKAVLEAESEGTEQGGSGGWRIRFAPHKGMLRKGNDVLMMFRYLEELGSFKVWCDLRFLPDLESLIPEDCYLAWDIELTGDVPKDLVEEAFEWVEGECELSIMPLGPSDTGGEQDVMEDAGAVEFDLKAGSGERTEQRKEYAQGEPQALRESGAKRAGEETKFVRVDAEKIEALLNLVGELVIIGSRLERHVEARDCVLLKEDLDMLSRNTRDLQESVIQIRMIPLEFALRRLPRLVRDLAQRLGKSVELKIHGADTELDKNMLEHLVDPLVHLIRNSVDHGIEPPEEREALGKPRTGLISVQAFHQSGGLVVEVLDDGRGIDRKRLRKKAAVLGITGFENELDLIFVPGMSTAGAVSEISGRGVGLDVVRNNLLEVGGSIFVETWPGKGTRFVVRLPLTLSILDGQFIKVEGEVLVLPLFSLLECLQVRKENIKTLTGRSKVLRHHDAYLPLVDLGRVLGFCKQSEVLRPLAVVTQWGERKVAFLVDELLGQQQVVVKSLDKNFRRVEGVLGGTVMGDGSVALILDVAGLVYGEFHRRGERDGKGIRRSLGGNLIMG